MDSFNPEVNDSVGQSTESQPVESTQQVSQTPTETEIKADGLYRIPGQAKPVKWDDYSKGLQGTLTKATQEAARLRAENAKYQKERQDYENRLNEYQRQQRLAEINKAKGSDAELVSTLRNLPYLKGDEAAYVVEGLYKKLGDYQGALEQRDFITLKLAETIKDLRSQVNTLMQTHSGGVFENKISGFLKDLNLSDDSVAGQLAKEIYLAYEGDDLDSEFPQIFQDRWNSLEENFAKRQKAKVEAARKAPFVPGRGGVGNPSRPLQASGKETAQEIAEKMWPGEPHRT